jgi:hypothetical protein
MAGDLEPARHVTRCRRLSGDDVVVMMLTLPSRSSTSLPQR